MREVDGCITALEGSRWHPPLQPPPGTPGPRLGRRARGTTRAPPAPSSARLPGPRSGWVGWSGSTGSGRDTRPCGIGFVCKLAKPTQEAGADRFGVVCRVPGEEGQFDASRVRREASAVWRSKQGHVTIRFTVTVIRLRGAGPSHRRLAFVLHGFHMACRKWGGRALLTDKGQGRVAHLAN